MTKPIPDDFDAIQAVDELKLSLNVILEALDEMAMDRAAISVNNAIIHLDELKTTLQDSITIKDVSPAAFEILNRIRAGQPDPRIGKFG